MEEKEQDNIAAFDTLFTTNRLQIIKTLLPCFDRPMQRYLAVYIKYQELQYTISYFKNHPYHICGAGSGEGADLKKLLPALLPYCSASQQNMLRRLEQTLSSFETMQEIMEMAELLKDMEPAGDTEGGESAAKTPDIEFLLSLLSPKQQTILENLKGEIEHDTAELET